MPRPEEMTEPPSAWQQPQQPWPAARELEQPLLGGAHGGERQQASALWGARAVRRAAREAGAPAPPVWPQGWCLTASARKDRLMPGAAADDGSPSAR